MRLVNKVRGPLPSEGRGGKLAGAAVFGFFAAEGEGFFGEVDRGENGIAQRRKAAFHIAAFGKVKELRFGAFDRIACMKSPKLRAASKPSRKN